MNIIGFLNLPETNSSHLPMIIFAYHRVCYFRTFSKHFSETCNFFHPNAWESKGYPVPHPQCHDELPGNSGPYLKGFVKGSWSGCDNDPLMGGVALGSCPLRFACGIRKWKSVAVEFAWDFFHVFVVSFFCRTTEKTHGLDDCISSISHENPCFIQGIN